MAVTDVIMPKLAMGMSEGTVVDWKVAQGEAVEQGTVLLEIETEKVTYEIEAAASGMLNILVPMDETVPTYHVIGQIADSQEEFSVAGVAQSSSASASTSADPVPTLEVEQKTTAQKGRIKASPVAKKLAAEHGLDLASLKGTGPGGKIGKEDVLAAVAASEAGAAEPARVESVPSGEQAAPGGAPKVRATIPLRGVRKAIATNMMQSLASMAQLTCTIEYDAGELVSLRKSLLSSEDEVGFRVSYLDLITMIVSRAVRQVPIVNSSIVDDEIRVWDEVNIGIAVATQISEYETGLFVPVVRDAGRKALGQIGKEIRELTAAVRSGQLTPDQMSGGTMTVSSGSMGSGMVMATPIMNMDQAMLVQPGLIEDRAVVRDGQVVVRPVLRMNYTFDHRIVDGVPFAKFVEVVRTFFETPGKVLV